jgi:hypothetical protein
MRLALEVAANADYGITGNKISTSLGIINTTDFASGVADKLYSASGSLADDASVELDLLTILGFDAVALGIDTLTMLVVRNTTAIATGAASIILSGGASNKWTAFLGDSSDTVIIPPESALFLVNYTGWTVDATHKTIKLTHDGTGTAAATYEIAIVGVAA